MNRMVHGWWLALTLLASVSLGDTVAAPTIRTTAADPTIVTVRSGRLHGSAVGDSVTFRGVPYARPPVGIGRSAPPGYVAGDPGRHHRSTCLPAAGTDDSTIV
jgi:hypothetical protein